MPEFLSEPAPESSVQQDRHLAERLLRGEEMAVAQVRRWVRRATARYRRFVTNDLDDLEQDVLVSLIGTLEESSFRFESRLETYVSRMAHYRCIDRMRAASQRQWIDIEDLDLTEERANAAHQLESRQAVVLSLRIAAALPAACRELWEMIHNGLSYREMAEQTGVSAGTLRVRVLRCRRKAKELRKSLEADQRPHGAVVTPHHSARPSSSKPGSR